MATEVLVDEEIRLGRHVVESLEKAGVPLRAAMWYFAPEFEDWRLLIATSIVRKEGPRRAYDRLQRILSKDPEAQRLQLSRIWLVEDDFALIDTLARFLHLGRGSETRFTENRVQGYYIKDALIYRLNRGHDRAG